MASPCGSLGRQLHAPQPGLQFANICSAIAGAFPAPRGVTGLGKVCRVSKRRRPDFGDSGQAGSVPGDLPLVFHLSPDSQITPEPLANCCLRARAPEEEEEEEEALGVWEGLRQAEHPAVCPPPSPACTQRCRGRLVSPQLPAGWFFSPRIPSQRRILQLVALNSITGVSIGAVPLAGVAHTTAASPEPADLRRIRPRRRQIAKITF